MGERFGQDRHSPLGEWVQTTPLIEVVGLNHRPGEVAKFFSAVRKAERKGLSYGIMVVPEPNNPHDRNAIKVIGFAESKPLFGGLMRREWHVGYVERDMAAEVTEALLANRIPISAELYRLYEGNDYREIQMFVLAPPGNSYSTRTKRQRR